MEFVLVLVKVLHLNIGSCAATLQVCKYDIASFGYMVKVLS